LYAEIITDTSRSSTTDGTSSTGTPRHESVVGVPSQPIAVDWDDDGLTDLILAPEGRFFRRHGTGETEKDWAIGGAETGLVWCFCAPARARWYTKC